MLAKESNPDGRAHKKDPERRGPSVILIPMVTG
jgi:hypothetical protein